jgi:UDP-glucuronate 4-epimerase
MEFTGMQQGDVVSTHADTTALQLHTGYSPKVSLDEGIREFVRWYREYYS